MKNVSKLLKGAKFKDIFVLDLCVQVSYKPGISHQGAIEYSIKLPQEIFDRSFTDEKEVRESLSLPISILQSIQGNVEIQYSKMDNQLTVTVHLPEKSVTEVPAEEIESIVLRMIIEGRWPEEEENMAPMDGEDSAFTGIDEDDANMLLHGEQELQELNSIQVSYTWQDVQIERAVPGTQKTYSVSFNAGVMQNETSRDMLSFLLDQADTFVKAHPYFTKVQLEVGLDIAEDLSACGHTLNFFGDDQAVRREGMNLNVLENEKSRTSRFDSKIEKVYASPDETVPYVSMNVFSATDFKIQEYAHELLMMREKNIFIEQLDINASNVLEELPIELQNKVSIVVLKKLIAFLKQKREEKKGPIFVNIKSLSCLAAGFFNEYSPCFSLVLSDGLYFSGNKTLPVSWNEKYEFSLSEKGNIKLTFAGTQKEVILGQRSADVSH